MINAVAERHSAWAATLSVGASRQLTEANVAASSTAPRVDRIRNEVGTEQTAIQVHPRMRIDVYGTPTDPVPELMRELAGSGVPVTVKTLASGFNRLPDV